MKKAVILLSGGLDSATTLFIAGEQGFELHALSFDYGQKHRIELIRAKQLAELAECRVHKTVVVDSSLFSGTALVNSEIKVPENRKMDDSIPVTYVPARNALFLAHGLSYAESIESRHIFIGANILDYSGYPDCRPEFFRAFEIMANLGTKAGMEGNPLQIETPIVHMNKAEIIKEGIRLGLDYSLTSSCYNPGDDGKPCQKCDSCILRKKGFHDAGIQDPLLLKFQIEN